MGLADRYDKVKMKPEKGYENNLMGSSEDSTIYKSQVNSIAEAAIRCTKTLTYSSVLESGKSPISAKTTETQRSILQRDIGQLGRRIEAFKAELRSVRSLGL